MTVNFLLRNVLVATALSNTRHQISFVSAYPLGPYRSIFIPPKLCGSVHFAIRYYHSNHIGITLSESTSRLYPILLVGEQIDQNISLQREMVQECVKRQGAQDRESKREGEREGELERCWNRDDVRECVKTGEGDPWKRVRVGGGRSCTQRQKANIKRQTI